MRKNVPPKMLGAVEEYALRLRNALRTFRASDDPLWKRTKEGLDRFGGLPMDHLPPKLIQEIEGRFGTINAILAEHSVDTFEDYRRVPAEDLVEIQDLIEGFAFDEKLYEPGRRTVSSTEPTLSVPRPDPSKWAALPCPEIASPAFVHNILRPTAGPPAPINRNAVAHRPRGALAQCP